VFSYFAQFSTNWRLLEGEEKSFYGNPSQAEKRQLSQRAEIVIVRLAA
jgi:hypothetical protein